jgi:fibronectin type 3 domain-containing protein
MMKRFLIALVCLLLMPLSAIAADATVSWDAPLAYEDGTPLPLSEISSYKIYQSTSSTGPFAVAATVSGASTSMTIINLARGTYYFYVTTVATNGQESISSNQVSKTISNTGKPKAPRNVR